MIVNQLIGDSSSRWRNLDLEDEDLLFRKIEQTRNVVLVRNCFFDINAESNKLISISTREVMKLRCLMFLETLGFDGDRHQIVAII